MFSARECSKPSSRTRSGTGPGGVEIGHVVVVGHGYETRARGAVAGDAVASGTDEQPLCSLEWPWMLPRSQVPGPVPQPGVGIGETETRLRGHLQLARRLHLVQPPDGRVVRRVVQQLGIGRRLLGDLAASPRRTRRASRLLSVSVGSIMSASGTISGK